MSRRTSNFDAPLSEWLEAEGIGPSDSATAITDVARVRALLIAAAREGRAVSYSEVLAGLGLRFTRPKMRALCKTLDRIDAEAAGKGRARPRRAGRSRKRPSAGAGLVDRRARAIRL